MASRLFLFFFFLFFCKNANTDNPNSTVVLNLPAQKKEYVKMYINENENNDISMPQISYFDDKYTAQRNNEKSQCLCIKDENERTTTAAATKKLEFPLNVSLHIYSLPRLPFFTIHNNKCLMLSSFVVVAALGFLHCILYFSFSVLAQFRFVVIALQLP